MSYKMGRTRQTGAVLLAVTIMMAIIGALAYSLSRQTGMASQSVEAQYDATSARYLAEAGLNMARWVHQNQGCKPKPVSPVAGTLAGAGAYNVVVSKAASKNIDIVATATTATGAVAVLARAGVLVYPLQDTPETKTLSVKIIDTYVNTPFTAGVTNNGGITLPLSQGTSQALLQFPLTDIPAGALVSSATLTLVQNGSSGVPRPVSMHRVTTQWDAASATWTTARAGVAWTTPGGDFSPAAAAQVNVSTAASNSWDVTTLLDAWASGRQPNYGVLVRMASALQSANFYSYEASTAWRPTVTVKFYAPC